MKLKNTFNAILAAAASLGLLTACVSIGDPVAAPGAAGAPETATSPQVRLDSGHQAPAAAERRAVPADATVVSLTFDDGNSSQYSAVEVMDELGLRGSFYVNSSVLDTDGYLSRAQLDTMVQQGHEIGGHGLQHRNLRKLDPAEVQRQVCWDRQNLASWGYKITSFAYPEAALNEQIEAIVEDCGYNSARGLGALRSVTGCEECPPAEDLAPANRYLTRAPAMVESDWTLEDMQALVRNAERSGGGWVQLTFHQVCPEQCSDISVELELFEQFASWLAEREQSQGTVVRTVDEVVGGQVLPTVAPVLEEAQLGGNLVLNPGMEAGSDTDIARCWQMASYGNNAVSGSVVPTGFNGSPALRLEMSDFTDGDAKFLQRMDAGECAPEVMPGQRYELKLDYQADADTQFVVYLRDSFGEWVYWTASDWLEPTDAATPAQWVTPQIPEGFTGLSYGLSLLDQGTLLVDEAQLSVYTG